MEPIRNINFTTENKPLRFLQDNLNKAKNIEKNDPVKDLNSLEIPKTTITDAAVKYIITEKFLTILQEYKNTSKLNNSSKEAAQEIYLKAIMSILEKSPEILNLFSEDQNNVFEILFKIISETMDEMNPIILEKINEINMSGEYFSNANNRRKGKFAENLSHCIEEGKLQFFSRLSLNDQTAPKFGPGKYSTEEREFQLNQIAHLRVSHQQKKIPPECSLIINLLADELHESCKALRENRNFKDVTGKLILKIYQQNIESLIGLVSGAGVIFGKYQGNISICTRQLSVQNIQENFIQSAKLLLDGDGSFNTNNDIFKKTFKSILPRHCNDPLTKFPEWKRSVHAFRLLEDFVTQEMHRLFYPLSNTPTKYTFSRVLRRANLLQANLKIQDEFESIDKSIIKKYSLLIERKSKSFMEFYNAVIPGLQQLEKNIDCKNLANLWVALENYLLNPTFEDDRGALEQQFCIDYGFNSESSNLDQFNYNPSLYLFIRLCLKQHWSFGSLMDEIYLLLLINLIKISKVSNLEIDTCIEEWLRVGKMMLAQNKETIKEMMDHLPEEHGFTSALRDTWRLNFEINKNGPFLTMIQHLEIRLQRCHKNPNDQIERALSLRDALNLLSGSICQTKTRIGELLSNTQTMLLLNDQENSLHLKILQEMQDLNTIQREGFMAATEGIKALIGRCFKRLEFEAQEAQETASKDHERLVIHAQQIGEDLISAEKARSKKNKSQREKLLPSGWTYTPKK